MNRERACRRIIRDLVLAALAFAPIVAHAGLFGALDDLANAAEGAGVQVPNQVYEAGSVANQVHEAEESMAPSQPSAAQIASAPSCPPGYRCTPQVPVSAPSCPPGEVCTPDSNTPSVAATSLSSGGNLPGLDYPMLPQEQEHQSNPYYIHFVMPTQAFVSAHDPRIMTMGNPGSYRNFEISQNNRQLPYLSPTDWRKYIVETYRQWPHAQRIPTESLVPGDSHGGLYRIDSGHYRFFTHTAVSFFMGNAAAQARIAQERAQGHRIRNVWVMLDPDCTLSTDFYRQAIGDVDAGKLDVHVVIVGMDAGSPGRAEAILSSRVPGAHGAGVGEMAAMELAQNYDHFHYGRERGAVTPMHGDAAARHLVRVNDRLAYAVAPTYDPGKEEMIVYPTMLFRYEGRDYLYANIHSSPIWYTSLLNLLARQ
jgi:hypothetical protein